MTKILKTTYKDQVADYIYNLVLDGRYAPGDQLKESLLAREMGISRAPVREALKELIANGIVEYRPQVGNFIALLSPRRIVDSYTTRGVLEGYAIMTTRDEFGDEDIEELLAMVRNMQTLAEQGNRKMVVQVGGEFHDMLVGKSKNVQLAEYTKRLSLKLHVLFYKHWYSLYTPAEIGDRHKRIVDTLVAGDPVAIEVAVRDHYIETGTKIAELYQEIIDTKEDAGQR